jgi:hypothetical protein
MQNNKYKIWWDLFIMIILVFISIVVPFRLAFIEEDSQGWVILHLTIDVFFFFDILFTFFTSVTFRATSLDCTNHRIIAWGYLRSWFLVDVVSIMPIDYILTGLNFN